PSPTPREGKYVVCCPSTASTPNRKPPQPLSERASEDKVRRNARPAPPQPQHGSPAKPPYHAHQTKETGPPESVPPPTPATTAPDTPDQRQPHAPGNAAPRPGSRPPPPARQYASQWRPAASQTASEAQDVAPPRPSQTPAQWHRQTTTRQRPLPRPRQPESDDPGAPTNPKRRQE